MKVLKFTEAVQMVARADHFNLYSHKVLGCMLLLGSKSLMITFFEL